MAAKTTLNAKNLETLGAERLAALVMEVVEGDAARKRIARTALLEAAGGSALVGAVSKRLVSLRRANSWVEYNKRRAFIDDLHRQRDLIVTQIAVDAPKEAFDLIWRFMALADSVFHRIDDSSGAVGDVFRQACRDLGTIAAKAKPKPEALAQQVFRALIDANGFGEFDELIEVTAAALGNDGLTHLRALLQDARDAEPRIDIQADKRRGATGLGYEADLRRGHIASATHNGLLDIADALGDIDAYIGAYMPEQLTNPVFAAKIAERLVAAERAAEALVFLDKAAPTGDFGRKEWTDARLLVFEALERTEDAQALRWNAFLRGFNAPMLRDYLAQLPDFEDVEAEERALDLVASSEDIYSAMAFLIDWPAHRRASELICERQDDLDGDLYFILSPAAEALETTAPLAATLLLRAMIDDTLKRAKSTRYKHAARHLKTCELISGVIDHWGEFETHDTYIECLKNAHPRKSQLWQIFASES